VLKGLVLCGLLITIWLIVQAAVFHLVAPRKAFASMLASFAPTLPLYLLLYVMTPADLGFLPSAYVGADWRLGLVNGLVLQVLLFLTAGLFYSHADRSITVRLLIELARAPQQRLTLAQMQAVCGVEVLMADRLEIMLANRFLIAQGDRFVLTPKGWIGGSIGLAARKILRMKAL
jgi:hypothetical protein